MKDHNAPKFILHTKKLATIWNPTYFEKKDVKYVTGELIFNSLFSVACFATNVSTEPSEKLFASKVCVKIVERMKRVTEKLASMRYSLEEKSSGFFVRPFEPDRSFVMSYDQSRLGKETTLLMKLFMQLDLHFILLNRYRYEQEITPDFCTKKRNETYNLLASCLNDLHIMCMQFHKVRKNPSL
ncbi:hypothetical protein [Vibrio algicola]|uniref:hypothetical protein n=1 Tax=Vibrio algicola TaxID=2662262 RepID=UPI0015B785B1|nr:hypothetical protein [Vibrio algicola]